MPLLGTFGSSASRGFGRGTGARKYTISGFLVVAGGGSGSGGDHGGGAGAGGFRNITSAPVLAGYEFTAGKTYTVTVGAGGTSYTYYPSGTPGTSSQVSSITGTGISFESSAGGGGSPYSPSSDGGSGNGRRSPGAGGD